MCGASGMASPAFWGKTCDKGDAVQILKPSSLR